ncbi:MAG: DUF202 domain-containing protein [Edaphobacter sp.]
MQPDTRKLLRTGLVIFGIGVLAVAMVFAAFGGVTRQGPNTNPGWFALILAMGCIPTGVLTLLLGLLKLIGDRRR